MGICFGCVVPHPPLLVPDIGHGQEAAITATIQALQGLSGELAASRPHALVLISPHGQGFSQAMGVLTGPSCRGDLREWGGRTPPAQFNNDPSLVEAIQREAAAQKIPL